MAGGGMDHSIQDHLNHHRRRRKAAEKGHAENLLNWAEAYKALQQAAERRKVGGK
jgi:hypothetical protein